MPFHSIEPRRLYRQIADQIRGLIKSGEFPAGSRLPPERDLARQLGVSRPSVREALIALEVEGMVEVRIGSGIYVLAGSDTRAVNGPDATAIGTSTHDGRVVIAVAGRVAARVAATRTRRVPNSIFADGSRPERGSRYVSRHKSFSASMNG